MNHSESTRPELRELMLKDRSNTQAFEAYMDKVYKESPMTIIPDDIASDPVKLAAFLSRNK